MHDIQLGQLHMLHQNTLHIIKGVFPLSTHMVKKIFKFFKFKPIK